MVSNKNVVSPSKFPLMFETHPFLDCPTCGAASAFGVLHIGGNRLNQRCQKCRFTKHTALPLLDKKVIYLDQFAVSNIYKVRSGEILKPPHVHEFWVEFEKRIMRAKMSQAAIFPPSSIHRDETIVSPFPSELWLEHEMFGGNASLIDCDTLNVRQEMEFAKAFINGQPAPCLEFDVDTALHGDRNSWLPHLHITANSDFSSFADGLRESRDRLHTAMLPLFERWQTEKPTFEQVLKEELAAFGKARIQASILALQKFFDAKDRNDIEAIVNISLSSGIWHFMEINRTFDRCGISINDCPRKIFEFWSWSELEKLPSHKISAHIFAVIAARLAAGQKKIPTQGLNNDIRAISTFAPYVDAMFIDIECENLLNDGRLKKAVDYRALIFSKASSQHFFDYLESLEFGLSDDVKCWSEFLYELRPNKDLGQPSGG
jgi:hypothetical protein